MSLDLWALRAKSEWKQWEGKCPLDSLLGNPATQDQIQPQAVMSWRKQSRTPQVLQVGIAPLVTCVPLSSSQGRNQSTEPRRPHPDVASTRPAAASPHWNEIIHFAHRSSFLSVVMIFQHAHECETVMGPNMVLYMQTPFRGKRS